MFKVYTVSLWLGAVVIVFVWYGSWIYNYLCNQCLSPLRLWIRITLMARCTHTTLCDKVYLWLAISWWFSLGTPVSSTNKTDRQDITEILLILALNTMIGIRTTLVMIITDCIASCKSNYHTITTTPRLGCMNVLVQLFVSLSGQDFCVRIKLYRIEGTTFA